MLYWAEGTKDRNSVRLANSDPDLIAMFRRFLTDSLDLRPDRIKIRLNVYLGNGLSLIDIEEYWLGVLELPRECLLGHTLNHMPTSSSGKKKARLPYGVCHLAVNDTRLVQHIYGAIQAYGGFERRTWLDGKPRKRSAVAKQ